MALPPINGSNAPIAPTPARAASEARAAFFQAALGKVDAPQAPIRAPQTETFRATASPAPQARAAASERIAIPPKPDRPTRPGAILDLKI